MIEKPSVIITSLGRTGTEFFARLFAQIVPEATSVHEPDIFQNTGVDNKYRHFLGQVRRAGIWRMVILKALGKWTLADVSDSKFLGKLNLLQAVHELEHQRKAFIQAMPGPIYIEANIGYYGLLDITPHAFRDHRAIYLVRDGREWVRSHMNWGEAYGKRGIRKLISHNWPGAHQLGGDPLRDRWHKFSRFEKLCWAWANLNEFALDHLEKNPNARLYKFEEVFEGSQKYRYLNDLVAFATSLSTHQVSRLGSTVGWLEKKSHQSLQGFPAWEDWENHQQVRFKQLCGSLMSRLGYQLDDKIAQPG